MFYYYELYNNDTPTMLNVGHIQYGSYIMIYCNQSHNYLYNYSIKPASNKFTTILEHDCIL